MSLLLLNIQLVFKFPLLSLLSHKILFAVFYLDQDLKRVYTFLLSLLINLLNLFNLQARKGGTLKTDFLFK